MTREELISLVKESKLSEAQKDQWAARISSEGLTRDVLDELKAALQVVIDAEFAALGVSDKEDDEYKKQFQTMVAEVDSAEEEFNGSMQQLNSQLTALQQDADVQVAALQAQSIKEE